MRFLTASSIALLACASALSVEPLAEKEYHAMYASHVNQFGLQRETHDLKFRLDLFKQKVDEIREHNSRADRTFDMGLNQFSDWTREEYLSILTLNNGVKQNQSSLSSAGVHTTASPTPPTIPSQFASALDYTGTNNKAGRAIFQYGSGAGIPVQNQGSCGSCWTFTTTAILESHLFLQGYNGVTSSANPVKLSEQALVDCDTKSNKGCNGGNVGVALQFSKDNKGVCTGAAVPYNAAGGSSKTSCQCSAGNNFGLSAMPTFSGTSAYVSVSTSVSTTSDESVLMNFLQNGPVGIAIGASASVFQNYKSGIISGTACGTTQNHAVTLVGYGTDPATGKKYWLIRNSWASTWGDKGYVKFEREGNVCGIGYKASYGSSMFQPAFAPSPNGAYPSGGSTTTTPVTSSTAAASSSSSSRSSSSSSRSSSSSSSSSSTATSASSSSKLSSSSSTASPATSTPSSTGWDWSLTTTSVCSVKSCSEKGVSTSSYGCYNSVLKQWDLTLSQCSGTAPEVVITGSCTPVNCEYRWVNPSACVSGKYASTTAKCTVTDTISHNTTVLSNTDFCSSTQAPTCCTTNSVGGAVADPSCTSSKSSTTCPSSIKCYNGGVLNPSTCQCDCPTTNTNSGLGFGFFGPRCLCTAAQYSMNINFGNLNAFAKGNSNLNVYESLYLAQANADLAAKISPVIPSLSTQTSPLAGTIDLNVPMYPTGVSGQERAQFRVYGVCTDSLTSNAAPGGYVTLGTTKYYVDLASYNSLNKVSALAQTVLYTSPSAALKQISTYAVGAYEILDGGEASVITDPTIDDGAFSGSFSLVATPFASFVGVFTAAFLAFF